MSKANFIEFRQTLRKLIKNWDCTTYVNWSGGFHDEIKTEEAREILRDLKKVLEKVEKLEYIEEKSEVDIQIEKLEEELKVLKEKREKEKD